MNEKEQMLYAAISGTERMSGFDGEDEGSSYFDGDDFDSFEGEGFMDASGSRGVAQSDPYILQYTNGTTGDLTAYLFGANDYGFSANQGNPVGVTVDNLQSGTYGRLLAQSISKPFVISKWRFTCDTASQLTQTLTITNVEGNGNSSSSPMNLSVLKDLYQQVSNAIEVTKRVVIDGNTIISFTLKASAVLTISMYPTEVVSAKQKLRGGSSIQNSKAPRLSNLNANPVIIQTGQGVRSIGK